MQSTVFRHADGDVREKDLACCAETAHVCIGGDTERSRMTKNQNNRIGELETELKQRDARIMELTEERDKEQKLNEKSREGSDRWHAAFDAWKKRMYR